MPHKGYQPELIIGKLRQAIIEHTQGARPERSIISKSRSTQRRVLVQRDDHYALTGQSWDYLPSSAAMLTDE